MRSFLLSFVNLLFVVTLFAQLTEKYTSANLNLRTEPNTNSRTLTVLPRGTKVTLQEDCDCKWMLISYNGNIGYVYSAYLTDNVTVNSASYSKSSTNSKNRYYTNSKGERVQSPTYYESPPSGATALCRDGTYSFSRSRRGTCSHHGGVARWL